MGPLTENCSACHGAGVIPHERRKMENGEPDPADFKRLTLCEKCGGSGQYPINPKTIEERKPGNIADQIGIPTPTTSTDSCCDYPVTYLRDTIGD